uniref:Uncharacterized protein n=1 Tax=Cacopsylla melanoneura TaxID=428564 RepID=A0A8D9EXM2_9HEMI
MFKWEHAHRYRYSLSDGISFNLTSKPVSSEEYFYDLLSDILVCLHFFSKEVFGFISVFLICSCLVSCLRVKGLFSLIPVELTYYILFYLVYFYFIVYIQLFYLFF